MLQSSFYSVAVKDDTHWAYIDDMYVLVWSYTTFQGLLLSHPNGCVFAMYEHCSRGGYNNMETISETNELCAKTVIFHKYTIFNTSRNTCAVSVTKSFFLFCFVCCFFFVFCFCFSVLNSCSYWNSDILDAIAESAMLNDTIDFWISSSELPQNNNVCGADIAVNFVSNERGTPVCSWSSSELALERFIL